MHLLGELTGDAYRAMSKYEVPERIQLILKAAERSDQKPHQRQGEVLRKYERLERAQSESVAKFLMRFDGGARDEGKWFRRLRTPRPPGR